eukprot:2289400-Heterocapsa_arctica.AAC.1
MFLDPEKNLLRRAVVGHELLVVGVLLLTILGRLGNGLVQGNDAHRQRLDLLNERYSGVLDLRDRGLGVLDGLLKAERKGPYYRTRPASSRDTPSYCRH